jgi:hypothetical protein
MLNHFEWGSTDYRNKIIVFEVFFNGINGYVISWDLMQEVNLAMAILQAVNIFRVDLTNKVANTEEKSLASADV